MDIDISFEGVEEALDALARFVEAEERALKDALEYILWEMCSYARINGAWQDRTGNLRNSISVNLDTMQEWSADTPKEVLDALKEANSNPVIRIEGDDFVGCLSCGMEYGIWLETRYGIAVLTSAIDRFEPLIEQYFSGKMAVEKLDLEQAATIQYIKYHERKNMI